MTETQSSKDLASSVSREGIIQTVQTPLGFFVLVVLVIEVIFGIIAELSEGTDRTALIVGMLVLIFALVGIVAGMAIWRPEGLKGARPKLDEALTSVGPDVTHILKPKILCASTSQFEELGFDDDIATIEHFFKRVHIEHNLSSGRLRSLLTERQFDILHLLSFVEPQEGSLVLSSTDRLSSEGFTSLLEVCRAHLVVLASCDSIDLAAKASRRANVIAATTIMRTDDFIQWAECFYGLLSRGHSLSRAYDIARTTTNAPMVLLMKQDIAFS